MKVVRTIVPVVIVVLSLAACLQSTTSKPDAPTSPTANVPLTVEAAVNATLAAHPTATRGPDIEATVEVAVVETLAAQAASAAQSESEVTDASDRAHRSYPAPTGAPGFRKYYQKRCYPGCHYDAYKGTPTPQVTHP